MENIATYFATAAGAAAALMGLLFVALQFNLERRRSDVGWQPVARATFNIFTVVFFVSLYELIPFTDIFSSDRTLFLIAPAVAIYRQISTWLPVWKQATAKRLLHTLWLMIIPVLLYLLMMYYAYFPPGNPPGVLDIRIPEAVMIALLFLNALRNSWDLVLEAGLVQTKGD
ncbi:MAG TPA: hypothetical protein VHD90_16110 [Phototrophicaceae bacterium]|nr:hypothetical protein [Phototrophicaceae bacterium]